MPKTISVFNPNPNGGKSTVAVCLANAFAQTHGDTILIDVDTQNVQKRASYYYGLRPKLPKPFICYTVGEWQSLGEAEKNKCAYIVVDTEKNPSNGLAEAIGQQSDIVLIPVRPDAKSWKEDAENALLMLGAHRSKAVLISNNYIGGDTAAIEQLAEGAGVEIMAEIPRLPIDDCINQGWLPQYRTSNQHGWKSILSVFAEVAGEVADRVQ